MVGRIFISYRRDDTAGDARSVYQRMQRTFGSRQLFMDVDSIQRGRDFHKVLDDHLRKSAVMLAVIGPRWLDSRDADGNRRLDDPDDFIRLEVARALKRDIAVIPLLVGGARMPKAGELPDDLRGLIRRQGITVRHENFPSDMDALEKDIRALLRRPKLWRLMAASSAALAVILLVSAYYLTLLPWPSAQTAWVRQAPSKAEGTAARVAADNAKRDEAAKREADATSAKTKADDEALAKARAEVQAQHKQEERLAADRKAAEERTRQEAETKRRTEETRLAAERRSAEEKLQRA